MWSKDDLWSEPDESLAAVARVLLLLQPGQLTSTQLQASPPLILLLIRYLYSSLSFIQTYAHPFICSSMFIQSFVHLFICSYLHSYVYPFMCSSIHVFIHSYAHPFICPSIHEFIHSCVHPFIHSYVHPFICASICLWNSKPSYLFENLKWKFYLIGLSGKTLLKGYICTPCLKLFWKFWSMIFCRGILSILWYFVT